MKDKKKIGILGCGWLGKKLVSHFSTLGYMVYTTNTSPQKSEQMRKEVTTSFLVNFSSDHLQNHKLENKQAQSAFSMLDVIIISLPMSKTKEVELQRALFQNVRSFLGNSKKQLFLLSSIGIYPQVREYIDEDTFSSDQLHKTLNEIEKVLAEKLPDINILRLAGLMGKERMFCKYYKESSRNEAVNHVHFEDICKVIEKMILQELKGKIYNVVAPLHPTKGDVYAHQTNTRIEPGSPEKLEHRIISSEKMIRETAYSFVFPDPKLFV